MKIFFKLLALAGVLALLFGCGGSSNNDDVDVDDGVADAACGPVVDISENAMVSGRLEEGDCVLSTIFPDLTTHAYVDEYRVTLAISGDLTITMRSSQFASYIYIVDTTETCSGGCDVAIILDEDAFSGGGVMGEDAQITISLTPGTYMIFANSNFPFLSFEIGDYSLETNFII